MTGQERRAEPTARPVILSVWRCPTCNTILAKLVLGPGSALEIKCARCNTVAFREKA